MQFIDDRGFADAGIAGNQNQLRRTALDHAIEDGEQAFDLALSPVQLLRDQQPIGGVVFARREGLNAPVTLPLGQTAPQIVLEAGGGLVALLGGLGEEFHHDLGDDRRDAFQPLRGSDRLSGDMAMDPFHRIGGAERQETGEHLIERHAERVEVAARVDRAVHAPGLFGSHIGERASDELGRLGRLTLAQQTRGDAEPGEARQSVRAIDQDIGRLDVLVDEGAQLYPGQRGDDFDGEDQERPRLHRLADEPLERLAARVLEQQRRSTAFPHKRERPRRPCGVEFVPQLIFVGEASEACRQRTFRSGQHDQHGVTAAVAMLPPPLAEDAIPSLPEDLEAVFSLSAEPKRSLQ